MRHAAVPGLLYTLRISFSTMTHGPFLDVAQRGKVKVPFSAQESPGEEVLLTSDPAVSLANQSRGSLHSLQAILVSTYAKKKDALFIAIL